MSAFDDAVNSAQVKEAPTVEPVAVSTAPAAEYPNAPDAPPTMAGKFQPNSTDLAQWAQSSYVLARDKNPEEYVKAEGIARRTGLPLTTVLDSMKMAQGIDETNQQDFGKLATEFPETAKFITDARKAAIVHDDIKPLTDVETAVVGLKYLVGHPSSRNSLLGDTLGAGFFSVNQGIAGVFQGATEMTGQLIDRLAGTDGAFTKGFSGPASVFAEMGSNAKRMHDIVAPPRQGIVGGGIASGLESSGMMATLLPLALVNPVAGAVTLLGTMAAVAGGQTYGEDRAKGINPSKAFGHGMSDAVIEFATERLPVAKLADILGGKGAFVKNAASFIWKDVVGEQLATVGQDFNKWMVENPEKTLGDFARERPGAAAQTLIATLVGGGVTVGATKALQVAFSEVERDTANAERSEAAANAVNDLVRSVQATKTLQRDPETVQAFVDQQLGEGVKNVYISGEMLAQSELGQALAQGSPEFAAQLAEAVDAGIEMAIPIASLASMPNVEQLAGPLADHFRVETEKFTRAEAKQFMDTHQEEMQKEIARVLTQVQDADAYRAQIDEVKQVLVQQLDATGRYDSKANDVNATLVSSFFGAQAARFGMTPMDLYKAYEYKVQAAGQVGEGYDQAAFGPQFDQFKGDAQGAIAHLTEQKTGEALGALHHPDIGDIDLVWGHAGTAEKDYADGYGLAKIARKHPEVLSDLQGALAAMRVSKRSKNRIILESPDHLAAVSLNWHGAEKKWMLTAYAKEGRGTSDARIGVTGTKADSLLHTPADILDGKVQEYKQGERGGFNPSTFTTTLFKGADLSTFLHESGHFFLEMQMDLAAKLDQEAEAAGGISAMSPGQQDMMRDSAALLKWFGVRDLAEWRSMTLDEKRIHHEQFARSFEAYLYEGKAPSIELDSVFQTFRSWLANVYRAALDLVRGDITKALDVQISDEVRGVMDRMLATSEQISLAENARSMLPLFNSPQEAGMTQEEFAAYHLLSASATLDAVQDLQARALRDMQWQRNAHGREVAKLQKLSESLRKQVRIEARAEILSQPVYRVYQFLTAKLSKDDKIEYTPLKSDPNVVSPEVDSLFVAIAKLGGIDRAQAESEWGWPKKERSPQAGIKYVLRTTGGLSIDMMAEALVQDGYLNAEDPVSELEGKFDDESRGKLQYSNSVSPDVINPPRTAGETVNLSGLDAGRLELQDLSASGYTKEQIAVFTERGMTARDGLSAEGVAALSQEFDSGDALVKALLEAAPINEAIEATTDRMMLERYGELATLEAIIQSADRALYTDTRARAVAAEMTALEKALGPTQQTGTDKNGRPIKQRILPAAAKSFAQTMIARLKIRNLSPGLYAAAQTRSAKAAIQAMKKGDTATAAMEKRNELINLYAAKAAIDAQREVPTILDYFKKVQKPGTLPAEHFDQILSLLAKFDLRRAVTNRELDNRARFSTYVASQLAVGNIPPNIEKLLTDRQLKAYETEIQKRDENDNLIYADEDDQAKLLAQIIDESPVRSFKDVTVEELRGLRDTIKQIEHMGRRTKKVLTDRQNREFDVVLAEMRDRLVDVATEKGRRATDNITANDLVGRARLGFRGFFFSHIKAANLLQIMDGADGGPLWDHLMSTANEAGAQEAVEAGKSTDILEKLLAPLRKSGGRITGKKTSFPSIGRSLNKQSVLAMALNMGNDSNQQRLLGGYGWTVEQIKPVLDTLTAQDWHFVQGMWDHFESFRPRVGEMERIINGVEPNWIEARELRVHTADNQDIVLRGGYAPVIYDPRASGKAQSHADSKDAKAMMQAARVASTVQKSFTKARVEEVKGRPLMLALNPYLGAVQDTIHYLNWQPWIIDANRMISRLDPPLREFYGAEVVKQLRDWAGDNAAGMRGPRDAAERGMAFISRNVSYVGLAYNVVSALKQVTGITQSMAIVGLSWMAKGAARTIADPRQAYSDMIEKSDFMAKRASTQFRELNELNAIIEDKNQIADTVQKWGYRPMTFMQNFVDIPTWWGAYEKAVDAGNNDERAVLLADQAVIDAQGSGMQKDLSSIERQQGFIRALTGFMSYMNTTLNVNYRLAKNADFKTAGGVGEYSLGFLMVNIIPVAMATIITQAVTVSGGSDEDKLKKSLHKYVADQVGFMFGQLIGFRELSGIVDAFGGKFGGDYSGPTGTRAIADLLRLAKQVGQKKNDLALWKSVISASGYIFRLPAAQINRTVTGANALATGKTKNPAALVFGFNAK